MLQIKDKNNSIRRKGNSSYSYSSESESGKYDIMLNKVIQFLIMFIYNLNLQLKIYSRK